MELNEHDIKQLERIAEGISKTLEITDMYLSATDFSELRMIIRKIKRDDFNQDVNDHFDNSLEQSRQNLEDKQDRQEYFDLGNNK